MRFRALSAPFVLWVCLGRVEPAYSAPEQSDGTLPASSTPPESKPEVLEVWIRGDDPAWIARAEGQLSDLPVRIRVLAEPVEAEPEQQLVAGKAVRSTGLVVWLWPDARATGPLSPQDAGSYVFAWSASAERLYVRRVGPRFVDSDAAEWSATLEIAALALRTAARAALAGQFLGVEPERLSLPEPPQEPGGLPSEGAQPDGTRRPQWFVSASAVVALDGHTDAGLTSLGATFQVELRRWRIGVAAQFGFPSTIESREAKLVLQRHALAALLGRVSEVSPTLHLVPELWAGIAGFRRETQSESPQLTAYEAKTTPSGLLGLGCSLEWEPFSPAFMGFELGASWVPGAPTLQLLRDDGPALASHGLWRLQPQGGFQFGVAW